MYEMLKVVPLKPCEPSLTFQVWCSSTESWEKGQPLYRVMSVNRPEKLYYHLRRGSESWWFALTHIFTEAEIVDDTIGLWPDHRTSGQLIQPQTSQFWASKEAEQVYCTCSLKWHLRRTEGSDIAKCKGIHSVILPYTECDCIIQFYTHG